jgi:hypothetical protein
VEISNQPRRERANQGHGGLAQDDAESQPPR